MAKLINGDGNPAIYAAEDSDWFASIMGNQTSITGVGSQFAATITDANTVTVADGVIITKEGRRIQLDINTDDSFTIPAGQQDVTNYYIIGYHLVSDDLSVQTAEKFVQLMDSASATIPEDTFRGGADDVYVSLYRVIQVGLTLTSLQALLPKITNVHGTEAMLATVQNSNKASRTFNKGEYIQLNNTYYKITATVASGATFTEGVNISATDIGAELTQINSDLTKSIIVDSKYLSCTTTAATPWAQVGATVSIPQGYTLQGIVGIANPNYAQWSITGFFWSNYVYCRVRSFDTSNTVTGDIQVLYLLVKTKLLT